MLTQDFKTELSSIRHEDSVTLEIFEHVPFHKIVRRREIVREKIIKHLREGIALRSVVKILMLRSGF